MPQLIERAKSTPEAASKTARFQHQPLDLGNPSIRVIKVFPELSPQSLIQCRLIHTQIDIEYRCLSYTWGPPENTHEIEVNGKPYMVRRNLWNFLNVARKKYPWCLFWIDALSIDQDNVGERNHQVRQTGKIYSEATEVIAWLGDDPLHEEFCGRIV